MCSCEKNGDDWSPSRFEFVVVRVKLISWMVEVATIESLLIVDGSGSIPKYHTVVYSSHFLISL